MKHLPENIIHFGSRKPLSEKLEEDRAEIDREMQLSDEAAENDRNAVIDLLDSARGLAEKGRLSGVILIGIDPMTDLFFNEINLSGPTISRETMFSYIGLLETMKSELMEVALMSLTINRQGDIVDAYADSESME